MLSSISGYAAVSATAIACLWQTNAFQWSSSQNYHSLDTSKPNITSLQQQILGTWKLVSYELQIHGPWAMKQYPLSKDATGLIIYAADGYMSAQLMMPGSLPFTARSYHDGSPKELAIAAKHYMAYSGTYSVDMGEDMKPRIRHEVKVSLYPNWLNTNQTRICKVDNGELTLSPDEFFNWNGLKVEVVLKWRK